ncbi:MAG: Slp family lipoprotein [Gammaproteobacteria bacterium]|nr:Slp family lipoprotein [Gammaproteobacteria bacterium]
MLGMSETRRVPRGIVLSSVLAVLLGGCATAPPAGLEDNLPQQPSQREAQARPDAFVGSAVRWGGEILSVRNDPASTDVEIFGRPLLDNAEPAAEGGDGIRFLARIDGFVDPAEYAPGKRLAVRGTLAKAETRPVGEFPYRYPVVVVERFHLWPAHEPVEPVYWRDPWFYDPWWPWGPWGPYRYRPYW